MMAFYVLNLDFAAEAISLKPVDVTVYWEGVIWEGSSDFRITAVSFGKHSVCSANQLEFCDCGRFCGSQVSYLVSSLVEF